MSVTRAFRPFLLAITLAVGCMAGAATTGEDTSPPAPAQGFVNLLMGATEYQREALVRLLSNKYPDLSIEMAQIVGELEPNLVGDIQQAIEELLVTKYEGVGRYIQQQLLAAPQLQHTVEQVIAQQYPSLIDDLQALPLPPGPDRATAVGKLIQEKYPQLLVDVTTAVKEKYPDLLARVQQRVLAKYPGLIIDITQLILRKYPGCTLKLITVLNQKYPELIGEVIRILTSSPPSSATATTAESAAAAPAGPSAETPGGENAASSQ